MKYVAILVLLFTSQSFAISDAALAQNCLPVGTQKLIDQAQSWNCAIEGQPVKVQDVDNRWYNPSKYIWYTVEVPCNGYESLTVLVQQYRGKCF